MSLPIDASTGLSVDEFFLESPCSTTQFESVVQITSHEIRTEQAPTSLRCLDRSATTSPKQSSLRSIGEEEEEVVDVMQSVRRWSLQFQPARGTSRRWRDQTSRGEAGGVEEEEAKAGALVSSKTGPNSLLAMFLSKAIPRVAPRRTRKAAREVSDVSGRRSLELRRRSVETSSPRSSGRRSLDFLQRSSLDGMKKTVGALKLRAIPEDGNDEGEDRKTEVAFERFFKSERVLSAAWMRASK